MTASVTIRRQGPRLNLGLVPPTDEDRALYEAHYGAGESYVGIARRLGKSAAWVAKRVQRVMDDKVLRLAKGRP